jgi:hypothetical protein
MEPFKLLQRKYWEGRILQKLIQISGYLYRNFGFVSEKVRKVISLALFGFG